MKKLLSLLISITMVICTLTPICGFSGENNTGSFSYVNPLTVSIPLQSKDENLYSLQSDSSESFDSVTDAISYLKLKMENRVSQIQFSVYLTDISGDAIKKQLSGIISGAVSNQFSTNSYDGDYLRWSFHGYNASYSYNPYPNNGKYLVNANFGFIYYDTKEQEDVVTSTINKAYDDLNLTYSTDYEKLWRIYNYVCNQITYTPIDEYNTRINNNDFTMHSAYGGAVGDAVCQGYALMIYRMLKENDIDSRIITSATHAWNIVKIGDVYYNVDATWDDTSGRGFSYPFFMKTNSEFDVISSHAPNEEYRTSDFLSQYPSASSDYDYKHNISTYVDKSDIDKQIYSGSAVMPKMNIDSSVDSSNYTYYYDSNETCGNAFVTVKGINSYFGSSKKLFKIIYSANNCSHNNTSVVNKKNATCTTSGYTGDIYCSDCETVIEYGSSISALNHSKNTVTTKATTSKNGSVVTKCTECGKTISSNTIYYPKTFTLSKTYIAYTGKNLAKPTVLIKDSSGKEIKSNNYSVTYINRSNGKSFSTLKSIGYYKIKITFKGNYSGTVYKYFAVTPKRTSIYTPTTGSRYIYTKWAKDSTVTGYQVLVSTNSSFKNSKSYNIKGYKYNYKKITGLKKGTKYYIKVRAYRTCKADGKNYNLYGSYSSVKNIKCK